VTPRRIATWRPSVEVGEEVVLYGYPLGHARLTTGKVLSPSGLGKNRLRASTPVAGGASGAPLIDSLGEVVGVVAVSIATERGHPNDTGAITSAAALAFLDAQGVSHTEGPGDESVSSAEVIERTKAFTVKVICEDAVPHDWEICQQASGDVAIAGCSHAISSREFSGGILRVLYGNRGFAFEAKGNLDRAIADYDEAIKLDPLSLHFYRRGGAYQAKGNYDRAIADYDEATKLDPKYAQAFQSRGNAFSRKRDLDRAIADFSEVIRLDPKYAYGFISRGNAYSDQRDYGRAIADYDEAIRLEPTKAESWNARCWARALAGQLQQAVPDCNESLRLEPNAAATLDSRGLVYLKLGDLDKALADYDAALKLDPKLDATLYARGITKQKMGNAEGAAADIAAAKALRANVADEFAKYGVS
jgi:tetratricopeptide (TPR) repeat protein